MSIRGKKLQPLKFYLQGLEVEHRYPVKLISWLSQEV